MSEATIAGAVASALEPAAAQLLEQLHADVSKEAERLEAEMPERMDAAEQAVKYWAGDAMTVIHRLVAKIDVARGGASTEPQPSDAVPPTKPSGSTAAGSTNSPATTAASTAPQSQPATATSSPTGTAAPSDAKPGDATS